MSTPDKNNPANGASNAATNSARSTVGSNSAVNVQSIISSIRTIAKTKELEQKVEKLIQSQRTPGLPGVGAERIVATGAGAAAGGAVSGASSPRDENKDPGSIESDAKTAADAAAQAAADALKNQDGTKQDSDQSTDKSDQVEQTAKDSITDPSTGYYRIGDLFTDQAPYPTDNGEANAPRIKAVSGTIGGKEVVALLRELTPYDNTPSGWEDSDHPPVEPGWEDWEQGYWGSATGTFVSGARYGHSFSDAALNVANAAVGYVHPSFNYVVEAYRNFTITTPGSQASVEYYLNWDDTGTPINTGWITSNIIGSTLDCGLGDPNEGANCPIDAPRLTEFPLGETLGFGWQDGKWGFHLYDSEGKAILNGTSSSTLMMTDDGKGYELGPLRNGGWYAAPTYVMPGTTPAILIRPNGTVSGYIDKNVLPYYTGAHTQDQNDNGFIGVPHLI